MTTVTKLNRFLGKLIDFIVVFILRAIFNILATKTGLFIFGLVGSLLALVYLLLRDALPGGQSIGKKVMKYRAVKADGSSLEGDFKTSVIRNVSLIIPFVDDILVLIDKPRLGDDWADTKVINENDIA